MNRIAYVISAVVSACVLALFGCSASTDARNGSDASTRPVVARFDPKVARAPKPSKSLTMSPDWQPPAPTRTAPGKPKTRVVPKKASVVKARRLGAHPTDAEFAALTIFADPLEPVFGESSNEETEALATALGEKWRGPGGLDAVEHFLESYPASRWAPSLHLNLGKFFYGGAYFQRALAHWKAAWDLAKGGDDSASKAVANLALAESAMMNARLGRVTEVEALLTEAQKRTPKGDARAKINHASEGAWMMRHQPGVSFRCGPYALLNVAKEQKLEVPKRTAAFLDKTQSPMTGFSIPEVHRMSRELGLKLQIAKRDVGAPVIAPAVVHWKLGHFAAVVREEEKGRFLLKDPTFGEDSRITAYNLDQEASGYFLVPEGPLPLGWSRATIAETAQLYGKGFTQGVDDPNKYSHKVGGNCQGQMAMAGYKFWTLLGSVTIDDTPISYSPAIGPDVRVQLSYPGYPPFAGTTSFAGFGNNWVWAYRPSYWKRHEVTLPDGSIFVYQTFVPAVNPPENPLHGQVWSDGAVTSPDGRKWYLDHAIAPPDPDGDAGVVYPGDDPVPPTYYTSSIADPDGKAVTVEYDDDDYPTRIHQLVDAAGGATVFHYEYTGKPYLVTSIDDAYGRTATFAYVDGGNGIDLQSIEDPFGIVSSFTYDDRGVIATMTTPYGTTTFSQTDPRFNEDAAIIYRAAEATDPLGQKERIEYNVTSATGVPSGLEVPYPSSSEIAFSNNYNQYRNSFYWDKLLTKVAPRDYSKARRYHWLHKTPNVVTDILESELSPLEGRVFYNYPGQDQVVNVGNLAFPSAVGRVVKNAQGNNQTQATRYEYNGKANVTKVTDPLGRVTMLEYDTNGIDVLAVRQKTGASSYATMSTYAYGGGAPAHRPASVTDGGANTTTYTYTSTGQVATITNAKGEVTTFTYETNTDDPALFGRLLSITGDVPGGNRTFTYDAAGRVATTTDSEGYTLAYDYDSLDRLRTVTYPDGKYEQWEYEDQSLVATRDREGRWTRHMYNGVLQRVLTQDPALRTTQFDWCRCGQLKRFVDGNGNITEWQRDEAGRATSKTLRNGGGSPATVETYTYDLSGRLSTVTDAFTPPRTVTYTYGVDDRLVKKDYSDSATPDVTYAYDTYFPRVTSRVDGSGTTTFTYAAATNGAGRVALVNGPLADDTLSYTYDELGRLKKLEVTNDAVTQASYSEEYTFDARGRATTVANNLGTTTYSFVGQSNRPSSVSSANGMTTQYEYFGTTGDFLLKKIKNVTSGVPVVISEFDYTYRPDRSIGTWSADQGSGSKTWTFGYDEAGQLTSATLRDPTLILPVESLYYGYDKAGNRVQVGNGTTAPKNYETNYANQLLTERDHGPTTFAGFVDEPATVKVNGQPAKVTSTDGGAPFKFERVVNLDGGTNTIVVEAKDGQNNTSTKTYVVNTTGDSKKYEYDANGNLRFEKLPNNTVVREYRWDQQNRLVKAIIGTHESAYEYDGASRRVKITEKENGTQTKQETFVWCGSKICQKRASNGSTVERNYFGNGFQEVGPLALNVGYFYTRDHLGSVREVVGSDGTTVASRLSYDPWGKVTETGSGALSDFTYTGHHYDRATGLALTWFRAYDPNLGRWISRDPSGLDGGLNLYGYVDNNPGNYFDPDGQGPLGAGIGAAAGSFVGFFGGMYAGAGAFGVAAIETGPGEVVAVPVGAVVGAVGGTFVGASVGSQWGSAAEEALKGVLFAEHTKNARPSTEEKHEKGQRRKKRDKKGGEKGDDRRKYKRGNGKKKNQGMFLPFFHDDDDDDDDDDVDGCP